MQKPKYSIQDLNCNKRPTNIQNQGGQKMSARERMNRSVKVMWDTKNVQSKFNRLVLRGTAT